MKQRENYVTHESFRGLRLISDSRAIIMSSLRDLISIFAVWFRNLLTKRIDRDYQERKKKGKQDVYIFFHNTSKKNKTKKETI